MNGLFGELCGMWIYNEGETDGWYVGKKCVEMDCNLRIFATGGGCKTDGFFLKQSVIAVDV